MHPALKDLMGQRQDQAQWPSPALPGFAPRGRGREGQAGPLHPGVQLQPGSPLETHRAWSSWFLNSKHLSMFAAFYVLVSFLQLPEDDLPGPPFTSLPSPALAIRRGGVSTRKG